MEIDSLGVDDVVALLKGEASDVTEIEAKAATRGYPKDLATTLSAFGNMPGGGLIVLGLSERDDFEVSGVYDAADAQKRLASQARNAVTPAVQVTFHAEKPSGKAVVLARVRELPATAKPCEVVSSGKSYLRSYDGDYALSELERSAFIAARSVSRYDRDPVEGANRGDLDENLITVYLSNCRARSHRLAEMSDDEILAQTRVLTEGGIPTLAGIYALGRYPQKHFPTLSITASVRPGPYASPDTRSSDIAHFDGPIPDLLESAIAWVRRNTKNRVRIDSDGHGNDEPEYPTEAVRELVANALIHRDLGPHALSDRVHLVLENDRLVVTNPGGLHGITVDQLGIRTSGVARNQSLYDICKDTRTSSGRRVIEGIGSGIVSVLKALSAASMTPPHFVDSGIRFTAIVPNHALLDPDTLDWLTNLPNSEGLSDVARHALALMRNGGVWTNASLRKQFPMDTTKARELLGDLVDRGLLKIDGQNRWRKYQLSVPTTLAAVQHRGKPGARSKNADLVLDALQDGSADAKTISQRTGLTIRQVRYAAEQLAMDQVISSVFVGTKLEYSLAE